MVTLNGNKLILEHPDAGVLTLVKWKLQPLGFKELAPYFSGKKVPVKFFDLKVEEDETISQIDIEAVLPLFAQSAAIVLGGWLPPSLALPNNVAFSDRNFVSHLSSHYQDGKLKKAPDLNSNLEDVEGIDFSFDVIPFAIEGNIREKPGRDLIKLQLDEADYKIKQALPRARIVQYADPVANVEKIINFTEDVFVSRQKFFFEFSKKKRPKVSVEVVAAEWKEILEIAIGVGLSRNDIAVLTALLIVSCETKNWPGRKIVKPDEAYSMKDAYNAASDFLIFELFLGMLKKIPKSTYSLMTGDKHLLALSALLGSIEHIGTQDNLGTYKSRLPPEIFGGEGKMMDAFSEFYSENIARNN